VKTIKSDAPSLRAAAQMIKDGNELLAQAKEKVDAGKQIITRFCADERDINIETLPIGEVLNVADVVLIEIGRMRKFDEKKFSFDHPAEHEEYKSVFPVRKFKPLI
jgi:hypothetical protein